MQDSEHFDYIIVGAGSAGCVLANRLTASGRNRVLLLESGGPDRDPWIHIPLGYGRLFRKAAVNWMYQTEPGDEWVTRPIFQPRGKVIGGSSSINGMIYIRGQREDYDHWRQLGLTGWSYEDCLPYFRKSEDQCRGPDAFHGTGGPLAVSDPADSHPLAEAYLAAAASLGFSRNDDFNGASQEGFGHFQWTTRNGRRCSAAVAYLKPVLNRPNLKVVSQAHATRLVLDGRRATGVAYRQGGGERTARADGEVIVSGGAFNSPQLLQLSGLGPASLLEQFGIPVVADMPGVGDNLQDHVNAPLMFEVNQRFTANDMVNRFGSRMVEVARYGLFRKGLMQMAAAYAGGFFRAHPASATPDIETLLMLFSSDVVGGPAHPFSGCTIAGTLLRPESKGWLRIKSVDPFAAPAIQPNYLAAERDRETLIAAIRILRRIAETPAFGRYVVREHAPGPGHETDDELLAFLREKCRTSYHPIGTCRMGRDDHAVVDERLRVRGIERLRVIDASVMPTLVSGNTNAPTIMIAEKGAEMVLADARAGVAQAGPARAQ